MFEEYNLYGQYPRQNPNLMPYQQVEEKRMPNEFRQKSIEIISLEEAVQLIKQSILDEKEDELFYEEILRQAPAEKDKNIIASIRDDERKHAKILRNLYFKFTNKEVPDDTKNNQELNKPRRTYIENIEKALFGELEAIIKYRRIMGAMPDNDSYTLIMSIMTDEIRHSSKYNFLYTKNLRRP